MEKSIESQEPNRLERLKRLLGQGTHHVVGMEGKDQMEQELVFIFHERGREGFRRNVPQTEQPLVIYHRDKAN